MLTDAAAGDQLMASLPLSYDYCPAALLLL